MVLKSIDFFSYRDETEIDGGFVGDGYEGGIGVGRVEVLFGGAAC